VTATFTGATPTTVETTTAAIIVTATAVTTSDAVRAAVETAVTFVSEAAISGP
jgi:hypothetical protein